MSLLWVMVAGGLYAEVGVITILLLPFISSKTWNRLFKSDFVTWLSSHAAFYFNAAVVILCITLFEALRQVKNHNEMYNEYKADPTNYKAGTEALFLMKLFRAQRNLYISGFALFLWFVFNRLVRLIADHARVTAAGEASLAQAKSASEAARRLINDTTAQRPGEDKENSQEVDTLRDEITTLKADLETELAARKSAENKLEAMKKQAEQTAKEYDRVSAECQQLQKELAALAGEDVSKKTD
ncbi:hypothetical protein Aperf_G00000108055 [Anoplocephala perfoliata]